MTRRIEWNPEYKDTDSQEKEFVDEYLTWTADKKWKYLMAIISQGLPATPTFKGKRRIEWK